jgi:hypothetical protein
MPRIAAARRISLVPRSLAALLAAAALGVMAACGGGALLSPTPSLLATRAPVSSMPLASATEVTPSPDGVGPIRIPLSGAAPDAVALDGDAAWVLTGEGGTLIEVDLVARREMRAIDVGFGATHFALPGAGIAAVARFDDSGNGTFLPIVDLASGAVSAVPTGALGGLASGDVGVVWALEKADRLLKVDVRSRTVVGEAPVEVGENVHTEVQWGAGSAWVGSDGTPVVRVGDDDLSIEATIAVDTGLPFLVEDGLVWGAGPNQLWAIDPATNEVSRKVGLVDLIEILALDIDRDDAWLAVRHPGHVGAVLRLDLRTGEVIAEYPVSLPAAVRLAPDRAWVASYETNELVGFAR